MSQINYVQQSVLFKKRANAETDLDNAVATLKQNQALVDKTKAVIAQKILWRPLTAKSAFVK
ncbi:MAG: hypothetical protein HWD59_01995 [Coxiellaceae bacterium]|nr:MAG: hypothetical protein HWD59_01995 [Coxiellaceae bacterium]